jgi:hypothetical protein
MANAAEQYVAECRAKLGSCILSSRIVLFPPAQPSSPALPQQQQADLKRNGRWVGSPIFTTLPNQP